MDINDYSKEHKKIFKKILSKYLAPNSTPESIMEMYNLASAEALIIGIRKITTNTEKKIKKALTKS